MSAALLAGPLFRRDIGATLVGCFIAIGAYGVAASCTYIYFDRFQKDRLLYRLLMALVFIGDTLDTFFLASALYWKLVDNFGQPLIWARLDLRFAAHLPILAVVATAVQFYFAEKIFHLFHRRLLIPGTICLFGVLNFVFSIVYTIANNDPMAFIRNNLPGSKPDWRFQLCNWLSAAADLIITVCMLFWFVKAWRQSEYSSTRRLLRKYLALSVETNLVTSLCAILCAIFYVVHRSALGAVFTFQACKLFHLTLAISLLSRSRTGSGQSSHASNISSQPSVAQYNIGANPSHELTSLQGVRWHPATRAVLRDLEKADKADNEDKEEAPSV